MNLSTYTPWDFAQELKTWVSFTPEEEQKLQAAKSNASFKRLLNDWARGVYDEDPETAKFNLINLY
jgi:hypothetical protein